MRITGGKYRGIKLSQFKQNKIRPTLDMMREKLFNYLGQDLSGATILDCFSGTGIMSFESLSRNAQYCYMVDREPQSIKLIHSNLEKIKIEPEKFKLVQANFWHYYPSIQKKFDLIFFDPPYHTLDQNKLLGFLKNILSKLNDHAIICVEHGHDYLNDFQEIEFYHIDRLKNTGNSCMTLFERTGEPIE